MQKYLFFMDAGTAGALQFCHVWCDSQRSQDRIQVLGKPLGGMLHLVYEYQILTLNKNTGTA